MIRQLNNSKTELYLEVKNLITSCIFPWFYEPRCTTNYDQNYVNLPFYSHVFLLRPNVNQNRLCSKINSDHFDKVEFLLSEIIKENNLSANCFYRVNANSFHPDNNNKLTVPHYDHEFPHKNLLIYLNDAGGETVVFNEDGTYEAHYPQEDDIILFDGLHCFRPPKEKRRIVLIATFI